MHPADSDHEESAYTSAKSSETHSASQSSLPLDAVSLSPRSTSSDSGTHIAKVRSGAAGEVSRIITAIRDDLDQDAECTPRDQRLADEILLDELELVSRKYTAKEKDPEEGTSEVPPAADEDMDDGPPLDQGFAWVIAFCGLLSVFSTWGANGAFGVFLSYYLEHDSFGGTPTDFALIGGIVVCLAQSLAPVSAFIYKIFGLKIVLAFGIVLQAAGYFLASFATKLWQIYLTQGVLVGVSFVFIFIPTTLVIPTWFKKKKATAMGILSSGSGLGAVVFAPSVQKVVSETGNQRWGLRLLGFVSLFTSLVVWVVMKPRIPNKTPLSVSLKKENLIESAKLIFHIQSFKSYVLVVHTLWFGITMLAYILILFSMAAYGTSVGLSSTQGSTLIAILNVGQTVGRPIMGMSADTFGRSNLAVLVSCILMILTFAYWINASTYGALIGYSFLSGMVVGVSNTIAQPIAIDILGSKSDKAPAVWSGMNIFVGICCLISEVLGLVLRDKHSSRPFLHAQIFTGCCYAAAVIWSLTVREWLIRRELQSRLSHAQESLAYQTTQIEDDLKTAESNEEHPDSELLNDRIRRYQRLLQNNVFMMVARAFYPIKV